MNYKKIIVIGFIVLFAVIQLFRIDKTAHEFDVEKDYLTIVNAPQEIRDIMKTSCYDCHSYETKYPWYSNIAPVSWFLKSHIEEARDHMNLSLFGDLSPEMQIGTQENCMYEIEDNEMPLKSYTLIHRDARLTDKQKETIIDWFELQTGESE